MIRTLVALACLMLPNLAAAEGLADFAAEAPITLQGDGPYYRLTVPVEAHFAAHSPDLYDLRVLNAAGDAMPFALIHERKQTERVQQQIGVPWFPLYAPEAKPGPPGEIQVERRADGTITAVVKDQAAESAGQKRRGYLLDLSQAKGDVGKLELDWDPSVTGFQQLTIEASDDLQSWRRWAAAAELVRLDYRGEHVEHRQIDLPGGHAAYLRLTWLVPEEAPSLTAAILTTGTAADHPDGLVWSEPAAPSRSDKAGYEWDFPHSIAIEQLKLALPQPNVLAPVTISTRGDGPDTQHPLGRAVLYRLLIDRHEWMSGDVPLHSGPLRLLRLEPDAPGGGLGGAPLLSIGLLRRELVFLARGDGPFTLAIGQDEAEPADLTPAILMPGYGSAAAPPISPAELGVLIGRSAAPRAAEPGFPAGIWRRATLWTILLLGVGTIGVMAYRLLRQTRI